jgi:hypothetical protein
MRAHALDSYDEHRLHRAIRQAEAPGDLTALLPAAGAHGHAILRRSCRFAHRAVLLFPTALEHATADFAARGLEPLASVPSVLVRRRLCARYGLDSEACDVFVTRLRTPSSVTGHNLEVFLFPMTASALEPRIVGAERAFGFEDHVALEVVRPDVATIERLLSILQHDAALVFEGGGHNPHEGSNGSTVLYFVGRTATGPAKRRRLERFELYCQGDFSTVLDRQPIDHSAVERAYST